MLIDLPHLLGQVISNTFAGFSTNSLISKLLSINILLSLINSLNVVTPIAVLIAETLAVGVFSSLAFFLEGEVTVGLTGLAVSVFNSTFDAFF